MSMEDIELNESKYSDKSHQVTLLLALFLGAFGVHRFYTGKIWTGVAILILSLSGFLSIVGSIWVFVDILAIAFNKYKDAEGKELADYSPGCAMIAVAVAIVVAIILVFSLIGKIMVG